MRVTTLLLLHHNSKNTGAIRSNFLWTLSGLMVSMSLHLGPVALPEVLRRRETTEHIVMLSSPHDSPFILVLCISRSSRNSDGVTPCGAAKQRWGIKTSQFSTITCYISEMVEEKWVYAARRFTSIESSFQPCDIYRDFPRDVLRGGQNVPKMC